MYVFTFGICWDLHGCSWGSVVLNNHITFPGTRFWRYARNYTGVLTGEGNEFSILQNTFDLNFSQRGDKIAFKVNPYLYHYFDSELELGLREAYLDMYFSNFDLRIGLH
jgi:hypothetical protein